MTRREPEPPRPTFILKVEGPPSASIRHLRSLLKALLRRYQFKCIEAREEGEK